MHHFKGGIAQNASLCDMLSDQMTIVKVAYGT